MTTLTSRNNELEIGPGLPTVLINDQLRVLDQNPKILEDLKQGNIGSMVELARQGQQAGTKAVDILVSHYELDEVELLPRIAKAVHDEVGCPVFLDTRDPKALAAAFERLHPYKACLNSVTAEEEVIVSLLPVVAEYKAAVVGIPIGKATGVPMTVEERISQIRIILEAATDYGIPQEDIIIDAICLASSAEPDSMMVTLETLRVLERELGLATILGIGNAGHGMPNQTVIDLAYLIAAIPWGLHSALVDPKTTGMFETVRAIDFLTNRDPYGIGYIADYRKKKREEANGG